VVTRFIKFGQKFGCPLPQKIWRPKNINISARFRTTSRLDRENLRNATRHRQSENGVANYGHSRAGELNLVYFGPQTAKNMTGVLTHATGGHQAGHCHASSCERASEIVVKIGQYPTKCEVMKSGGSFFYLTTLYICRIASRPALQAVIYSTIVLLVTVTASIVLFLFRACCQCTEQSAGCYRFSSLCLLSHRA